MKNYSLKLFALLFLIINGCTDPTSPSEDIIEELIFVACEGNFGASNGSIHIIKPDGELDFVENVGDVVQSLEVYGDKLIVLVNNSHKIKIYDIDEDGLKLPGITVSTENSSPRELVVVNDKIYFTNWNTKDVKVLNLYNYVIESSIPVDGLPESIIFDGSHLWVGIMMNEDYSSANTVLKIDIEDNSIINTYDVDLGPTSIVEQGGKIYVARTYYDENFNAYYGSTKIDGDVVNKKNYGSGVACGGSVLKYNNQIYRSYDGGIAPLEENLDIRSSAKIGSYSFEQVYSTEIIGDNIYFGLTNYADLNQVKVVDTNGSEINTFDVGIIPGDFAVWKND